MKEMSLMREFLGDSTYVRILDFLVYSKDEELTKKQLAEGADVSRAALFHYWPDIERHGLVRVTRVFGKTKLYTPNNRSPLMQKLYELELALIKQSLEKHRKKLVAHH
ncbi:MAG TPA: hypothetical protein VLJ21_03660 [Candidatus Binatia bacterium]|nr:hypothetical protein [Candidatus Binatia bacterium]